MSEDVRLEGEQPSSPIGDNGEEVVAEGNQPAPAEPRKSRRDRAVERATAPLLEKIKQLEAERPAQRAAQAEAVAARPKPKRADFADDDAFEDALVAWGNEKFAAEKAVKDAEAAQQRQLGENLRNYKIQVEEAKEKYPDWNEVVNQEIHIGAGVQLALLELENGADVSYYLGKHPAYAEKLGQMSQPSAIMEVGRLSERLKTGAPATSEANGGAPTKPKPKVPAPVRTVSTAGSSAALTFAEIAAKPNYPGKAKDLRRAMAAE
jgi:hypothetical protein